MEANLGVTWLMGNQSISAHCPASGKSEDQQTSHFLRLQRCSQTLDQFQQCSEILDFLVESLIETLGPAVGGSIADTSGGNAQQSL